MKILSNYIARKFWGPFIFIICIFSALIFLGDSIEKMRWISVYSAELRMVLKYSAFTMPGWILQVLPVVCLLSALIVISDMIASGEWTACLAGGFTVRQIFKPIIICIIIVASCGFLVQEFVVPPLSNKAEFTLQRRIRGKQDWSKNIVHDATLRLDARRVLFAQTIMSDKGLMQGMFIDVYDDNWAIKEQINAKSFRWNAQKNIWVFENGFIRYFGKDASVKEVPFEALDSDFSVPPKEISVGKIGYGDLSISELLKRIKFLNASGLTTFREYTFLHSKLSAPFATVIMCLLGMPLAIALKRSSKILNIISAVAIGFVFWWIVSMMTSAGESGMVSPIIAGWAAVGVFAVVAFIEFKILKI